ncbi:MAG TPA: DUF1269 domain-containing protein [Gammaproteobacteria bacterium]|nr:DUF1269 domain-containing protein [Gammaproteobacteria bacterium]
MIRLYFLVPDIELARNIVRELLVARVEEKHLGVIAREGTPMEELPEASITETSDVVKAAERGGAVGAATGVLAGVVATAFPPAGLVLGGGAVLAMGLAGAGVGAWASSLIGVSAPNSELREFEQAVEQGQILMLVDVPGERREEIKALIARHHPEVLIAGREPTHPAFP